VSKHVGVFILIVSCILLSASVGRCVDCKNPHGLSNTKFANVQQAEAVCNCINHKRELLELCT
jgi:hypothetical protein